VTKKPSPSFSLSKSHSPQGWLDQFCHAPSTDLRETKDAFEIQAELPGLGKEDVNIEFSEADGVLTISGEKRVQRGEKKKPENEQEQQQGEEPQPQMQQPQFDQNQGEQPEQSEKMEEPQESDPEQKEESEQNEPTERPEKTERPEQSESTPSLSSGAAIETSTESQQTEDSSENASKSEDNEIDGEGEEEEEDNYHWRECSYGRFVRRIVLPKDRVKGEDIKASFKNGVLRVIVPKIERQRPQMKRINIE